MSSVSLDDTFVMLCDWRGRCIWTSAPAHNAEVGQFVWEQLVAESKENVKLALGRAVALRESGQVEVFNRRGERFRAWLWPLDSPDVAVCLLGTLVPASLALLTDRERACLELLAKGTDTREIAVQLDVSLSTVHTHMRRAREKLGLPSVEALISFASRYCYPADRRLDAEPGPSGKQWEA